MKAILSDIHGNLEALWAVLDEIERLGAAVVYNLGDIVGYGPNPLECIDLSMEMSVVLKGMFDEGVLVQPIGFSTYAEQCLLWTRQLLHLPRDDDGPNRRRADFLASLQTRHQDADILYVHGSPYNPLNDFVFPEDIYCPAKMARIAEKFEFLCFNGHTQLPGFFVENGPGEWQYLMPSDCNNEFQLDGRKVMCNVGSVGQPRDGDWRAAFVLFDGSTICFQRVEYDIDATIQKIDAEPNLDHFYGDRLRDGR